MRVFIRKVSRRAGALRSCAENLMQGLSGSSERPCGKVWSLLQGNFKGGRMCSNHAASLNQVESEGKLLSSTGFGPLQSLPPQDKEVGKRNEGGKDLAGVMCS